MNISTTTTSTTTTSTAIFLTVRHNQFYKPVPDEERILIVKILCPAILITIFLIIITVVYIKCCKPVPRCTVSPSVQPEPRSDGTVTAGTWRKYKVMKERELPPIPEENICSPPHIDTPSSGDYKGFNDLYDGSLEPVETHLYSEISGKLDCTYPDLVQDYVHLPFDTTLHRTRRLEQESEEESIEPYGVTRFWDQSINSDRLTSMDERSRTSSQQSFTFHNEAFNEDSYSDVFNPSMENYATENSENNELYRNEMEVLQLNSELFSERKSRSLNQDNTIRSKRKISPSLKLTLPRKQDTSPRNTTF